MSTHFFFFFFFNRVTDVYYSARSICQLYKRIFSRQRINIFLAIIAGNSSYTNLKKKYPIWQESKGEKKGKKRKRKKENRGEKTQERKYIYSFSLIATFSIFLSPLFYLVSFSYAFRVLRVTFSLYISLAFIFLDICHLLSY